MHVHPSLGDIFKVMGEQKKNTKIKLKVTFSGFEFELSLLVLFHNVYGNDLFSVMLHLPNRLLLKPPSSSASPVR